MYCTECDHDKEIKGKKIRHSYVECGLDGVTLNGVTEYRCPKCGAVSYNFGDIKQLHQLIADLLLQKKGFLSGQEVRFLRSHIGYSGKFFADVLGMAPEALSRIENRKNPVTKGFDRHVRSAVYSKEPNRDYDLHDRMLNRPIALPKRLMFTLGKTDWTFRMSPA